MATFGTAARLNVQKWWKADMTAFGRAWAIAAVPKTMVKRESLRLLRSRRSLRFREPQSRPPATLALFGEPYGDTEGPLGSGQKGITAMTNGDGADEGKAQPMSVSGA